MDLQLAGRTVLVTGAGQGAGRAIGLAFAGEGANVVFHYNSSAEGAEKAAADARSLGVTAIAAQADLRDADAVANLVDQTEKQVGTIDVLINNAAWTVPGPFLESTPAEWKDQIDITVTGTLLITHTVTKRMADTGGGTVVSMMGDSGRTGEAGLLITATTRSTTLGLTKSLAKELARYGIRANAVSLGLVATDTMQHSFGDIDSPRMQKVLRQYPLRRLGVIEDIPPMVLMLASPLTSWVTGQVVSINGGYVMP